MFSNFIVGMSVFLYTGVAVSEDMSDLESLDQEIAEAASEAETSPDVPSSTTVAGTTESANSEKENSLDEIAKQEKQETPADSEKGDNVVATVEDGKALVLKKLNIEIPENWKKKKVDGDLLTATENDNDLNFQKSIMVKYLEGEKAIDMNTGADIAGLVQSIYGSMEGVTEYKNDALEEVELADGRAGMSFYSTYYKDDIAMMQLHLIVAEANAHYVATYTDLGEEMAKEKSASLDLAWDTLLGITIEPGDVISEPIAPVKPIALAVISLISGFLLLKARKMIKVNKEQKKFDDAYDQEDEQPEHWVVKKSEFPYIVSELEKFDDEDDMYAAETAAFEDDEDLPPLPVEMMEEEGLRTA